MFLSMIVKKVGRLDIPVYDSCFVHICQPTKQAEEVVPQVVGKEFSVVQTEIEVAEIWKNSNDLVLMAECCKQRTYMW